MAEVRGNRIGLDQEQLEQILALLAPLRALAAPVAPAPLTEEETVRYLELLRSTGRFDEENGRFFGDLHYEVEAPDRPVGYLHAPAVAAGQEEQIEAWRDEHDPGDFTRPDVLAIEAPAAQQAPGDQQDQQDQPGG